MLGRQDVGLDFDEIDLAVDKLFSHDDLYISALLLEPDLKIPMLGYKTISRVRAELCRDAGWILGRYPDDVNNAIERIKGQPLHAREISKILLNDATDFTPALDCGTAAYSFDQFDDLPATALYLDTKGNAISTVRITDGAPNKENIFTANHFLIQEDGRAVRMQDSRVWTQVIAPQLAKYVELGVPIKSWERQFIFSGKTLDSIAAMFTTVAKLGNSGVVPILTHSEMITFLEGLLTPEGIQLMTPAIPTYGVSIETGEILTDNVYVGLMSVEVMKMVQARVLDAALKVMEGNDIDIDSFTKVQSLCVKSLVRSQPRSGFIPDPINDRERVERIIAKKQ